MPKKPKATTVTRASIPMPARVQENEEFRPLAVSQEGRTLAAESIDDRVEEEGECGPVLFGQKMAFFSRKQGTLPTYP